MTGLMLTAALVVSGAASASRAQKKTTERPSATAGDGRSAQQPSASPAKTAGDTVAAGAAEVEEARYRYEFENEKFVVSRIRIVHDAAGRGMLTFERKSSEEAIEEPLELSAVALRRIRGHWEALRFLDSEASYQADKQFPHLGTVRLSMARGARNRTTEFNYSRDPDASALASEYRRAADQAMFVFDINVARDNQPLETPKLLEYLGRLVERGGVSDPQQLAPLLKDLSTDERVPLITRNTAGKILKKLEKAAKPHK
ncbi:MAG TPA: hypothetical protein VF240_01790 [Pyrinomonadaceae bacterium]